jgi:hypothetical protein
MEKADKFSQESYIDIRDQAEALIVTSLAKTESIENPLDCVPNKFTKWRF